MPGPTPQRLSFQGASVMNMAIMLDQNTTAAACERSKAAQHCEAGPASIQSDEAGRPWLALKAFDTGPETGQTHGT